MQKRREEIKQWLSHIGKNYKWLATKCFISEGAVRNWMSTKPIPNAKWEMIKTLMERTREEEKKDLYNPLKAVPRAANGLYLVTCPFTEQQWTQVCASANTLGISPEQFIVDSVVRCLGDGKKSFQDLQSVKILIAN